MGVRLNCLLCGKLFEPTCHISRQKYCSEACRIKYNNAKRYFGGQVDTCPECGDHVEQTGEQGRWRRFCSDRCRAVYNRKKRQEKRQSIVRSKQICPNCGIEFQPEWGVKVRRFCGDKCRIEWWKEYHKVNSTVIPLERKCACCGREFHSNKWGGGEYCSRDCYLQTMAQAHEQIICEWCGESFSALISANRKYCSFDCSVAAKHKPVTHKRAGHRIHYHDPEEWRSQIKEATNKAEKSYKRGKRVWLVCGDTSMYTGLDGLLGIIRYQLNHNPFDRAVYAFCDKTGTMLKYLEWDGAGFCIGKRRAQSGSYPWPPSEAGTVIEISEKEFEFLKAKSIVPFRTKNRKKTVAKNADFA